MDYDGVKSKVVLFNLINEGKIKIKTTSNVKSTSNMRMIFMMTTLKKPNHAKYTNPNVANQTKPTKPSKLNLPNKTKPTIPNRAYQSKPNLPNRTKPNTMPDLAKPTFFTHILEGLD